jgi:serine/threonine protein kinase
MAKVYRVGQVVNGYEIVEKLNSGNFGIAYKAKKGLTPVFLKQYKDPTVLSPWYDAYIAYQTDLVSRIQRSELKDFVVRQIEQFKYKNGSLEDFVQVYEWIDGNQDLSHKIGELRANPSAYPWMARKTWAKAMVSCIRKMHDAKIAHGDLKPENVIVIPDSSIGAQYRLRIIDTDFAVLTDRTVPWKGHMGTVTTAGWSSPEHKLGQDLRAASDVFTASLMIYELLAQGNPYASDDFDQVKRNTPPDPRYFGDFVGNSQILTKALKECLNPDLTKRPTMAALHKALLDADDPTTKIVVPPPPPPIREERVTGGGLASSGVLNSSLTVPKPLTISSLESGKSFMFSIPVRVGQALIGQFSAHAVYADKEFQYELTTIDNGRSWLVRPNPAAPNETIVNGEVLRSERQLSTGDEISVGRLAMGKLFSKVRVSL